MIFICKYCFKEFKNINRKGTIRVSKFCSIYCFYKNNIKIKEKICLYCKKEFKGRKNNAKFCNNKCYHDSTIINKKIKCFKCDKIFKPCNDKNRFCSIQCHRSSSIVWNKGKVGVFSEETIKKISEKMKGVRHPHTKESIEKISLSRRGPLNPNWIKNRDEYKLKKKIYTAWRHLLSRTLYFIKKQKNGSTSKILGYTPIQLKTHLESLFSPGMSWDNYGKGNDKWNTDHIKPISAFCINSDPSEINALLNLQPLWQHDNFSKSDKYIMETK